MANASQNKIVFKKKRTTVAIPNCAIDELEIATLGFYSRLLNQIQNENIIFNNKEELIANMLECSPMETRRGAEQAWNELVEKGYILYSKNEAGETVEVTYGPQGRIGDR